VIAVKPKEDSSRSDTPSLIALGMDGTERWSWEWSANTDGEVFHTHSVVPAGEGGVYVAGSINNHNRHEVLRVDSDRSILWRKSLDTAFQMSHLTRVSDNRLVFIGVEAFPSESRTSVFGLNANNGSVAWRNEEFEENYWVKDATRCAGRCVIAGYDDSYRGYVAGISGDGTKVWETIVEEYDSRGVIDVSSTGETLTILGRNSQNSSNYVVSLTSDGSQRWDTGLSMPDVEDVSSARVIPDDAGGWLVAATYDSRPDLYLTRLTDEGTEAEGYFVDGWDRTATIEEAITKGRTVFVAGKGDSESGTQTQTWAAGLSPLESTETATTIPTSQPPPTRTRGTETATSTMRRTRTKELTPSASQTTEEDGPGFGIAGPVLSILGLGAFEHYRNENESN